MKPIKLKRIYPKVHPANYTKRFGKAVLWGLVPLEPLWELILLPASLVFNKLRKKDTGDWIEIKEGKIIILETESSARREFEIGVIKDLKVYFYNNLITEVEDDVDEDQLKNHISRIKFKLKDEVHEYFYDCKKKEILKFCKLLYDKRIIFKEYDNGKRVFMGRQPKYNEIQELKEKYNIEW